jgi:hypothetical protein
VFDADESFQKLELFQVEAGIINSALKMVENDEGIGRQDYFPLFSGN